MIKICLLLTSLLILTFISNNTSAFEPPRGDEVTLTCYFHGIPYSTAAGFDAECNLPSNSVIASVPPHYDPLGINKHQYQHQGQYHARMDVHDPECFSWVYSLPES